MIPLAGDLASDERVISMTISRPEQTTTTSGPMEQHIGDMLMKPDFISPAAKTTIQYR